MTEAALCPMSELSEGMPRRFDGDGFRVVVVRIGDDVYAIGDRCSHQDVALSEGEVDTDARTIECFRA